ncbi:hypothetical protein [Streptomyces sp. S1]|uniref:hypothetical protein n=1 Tax=Streptomyces sp. S1 TaxID=718288 RepID=UPI003D730570
MRRHPRALVVDVVDTATVVRRTTEKAMKSDSLRITLECGHSFTTSRTYSISDQRTFACRAHQGCGYRIPWTFYESVASGRRFENRHRRPRGGSGKWHGLGAT